MSAYERAFEKTPVGSIEIKTLPAARLLAAHGEGNYFQENNGLFRPLFQYIQDNDIAMTIPVEAEIEPGIMYFYLGTDYKETELENTDRVQIVTLPERTVLSLGVRGSYSPANFEEAKAELLSWLAQQDEWIASGSARAIYWNGPFTIGFLKRAEVHIPVVAAK
ncbi:MAG: effector-binding domain-containing protein [Lentimonas sp.]|jgi:effector-binding domain-containing protein